MKLSTTHNYSGQQDFDRDVINNAMSAPLLSPQEERDLVQAWCDRQDEKAMGRLVACHQRMAVSAALKFRGYGLPLADMIQEGVIGLLEAAKRFDPNKEVRFCTYAGWWIRASMQDYILRNWSLVRIGSKSAHKTIFFNQSRIKKLIEASDGTQGLAKIAERFKVSEDDLHFMAGRMSGRDASLNATMAEEGEAEKIDFLEDGSALPDEVIEDLIDEERRSKWIGSALSSLSERERSIIEERFLGDNRLTLSSLGTQMGLSKERVRQIEKQAMQKLRLTLEQTDSGRFLN